MKKIIILSIILITITGCGNGYVEEEDKYEKNKKNTVTVIDLSQMTEAERDIWCDENKVNCVVKNEYSDNVPKDSFISQSIEPEKLIYEGDKIIITFSLGKEPTLSQKNAEKKAKQYLEFMSFSREGLIRQLKYEGFNDEDSIYGVDSLNVDWKEQAAKKAKEYLDYMPFSHDGLVNQLKYEGFTDEEAEYGVSKTGL